MYIVCWWEVYIVGWWEVYIVGWWKVYIVGWWKVYIVGWWEVYIVGWWEVYIVGWWEVYIVGWWKVYIVGWWEVYIVGWWEVYIVGWWTLKEIYDLITVHPLPSFIFVNASFKPNSFLSQLKSILCIIKKILEVIHPKNLLLFFFDKLWQLHSKIYQLVIILCCYILYFCLSSSVVLYNWCLVESYTMNMEQEEHKNRSKLYSNTASIS